MTESTEVRWFVRGDGPALPKAAQRSYTDSYCWETVTDDVSVKIRAGCGGGLIMKVRTDVLPAVVVGGVEGNPETWLRTVIEAPRPEPEAELLHVHKQLGRCKGVEVVNIVFDDEVWWSLAMRLRADAEPPRIPEVIESHLDQPGAEVLCCSYPTWLGLRSSVASLAS